MPQVPQMPQEINGFLNMCGNQKRLGAENPHQMLERSSL